MTHLGQRLSALIDGELEPSERERVHSHMIKCGSCQNEVAALWALKRRMNGLRESAAGAGLAGLTNRLVNELLDLDDSTPPPPPPGGWAMDGRPSQEGTSADRDDRPDQRPARFFLAGSVAIFLAGLGTAAVIAGGEPQARAPAPPVTPSVDVLVAPHNFVNTGLPGPGSTDLGPRVRDRWLRPQADVTDLPGQP